MDAWKLSIGPIALALCFAAIGCGGDDDETPGSQPDAGTDAAGAGGSAGTGGVGGTGGSSGQGGTSGSGGTAGTGGASGSSGQGGSGGQAGSAGTAGAAGSGGSAGASGSAGSAGNAGSAGSAPSCDYGSECGSNVCDPTTLTCADAACDAGDYQSCPGFPDTICLEQDDGQGACYLDCTPFDGTGTCGANGHCQVQSDDESVGICYYTGPHAVGAPCEPTDMHTDCVEGAVCVNFGSSTQPDRQCQKVCQVFDDGPTGCPAGDLCMVPAICLPSSFGFYDEVPVGAACTQGDYLYCGNVGDRLTGICDDVPTGQLRCYAWCRLSEGSGDCEAGHTCTDTDWQNGLGVCVQD